MSPTSLAWTMGETSGSIAADAVVSAGEATARDLALDDDGDLDLSQGDLYFLQGAEAIASDLNSRLSLFKGEWFLDLDEGLPYFSDILVKRPNLQAVRSIFRTQLLAVPGVLEVTKLELSYDNADRRLEVSYRVSSDLGELIVASVALPIP